MLHSNLHKKYLLPFLLLPTTSYYFVRIRVFYISLSIWYRVLSYCYYLYMHIRDNSLNYMYDNCVHCSVLRLCCLFLCSVLCCVLCSLCCSVCAAYCCILCAYCVLCRCIIAYVCVQVCGVRLRFDWTQSDTPLYGYLCGYRVRIIKAKKTQP